jgi:hypothetical protein
MLAGLTLPAGCSDGDIGPDADAAPPDSDAADEPWPDLDAPPDAWPDADADPLPDGDEGDFTPPDRLFDEMLLLAREGRLVLSVGAEPPFRGAVSCCGGAYGWPLVDEAWVDYVESRGVTFLHVRLGPFLTGPNGETDWAEVGGGYVEVEGRADLDAWNEAFWSRVRELIEYAGNRGMWVEVDVVDGWAVKHCRWGDLPGYSAWDADYNVQGEDGCASAGSAAVEPGSVHERWIRKVLEETGRYGNVIYQDGNEVGLVDGYSAEWTLSMLAILRDVEAGHGYGPHLFGTNSGHGETMAAAGVQYIELHQASAPDPAGCYGKPCLSNEYNPDPPMTPEEIHEQYCLGVSMGTYFWYWRHGQTAEQMDQSLALILGGCG